MGEIAEGSVITQTVTLRNTGKTTVVVSRVKTSCGCTTASSVPSLAPGASTPLQVRYDAHGKTGRNQQFVWLFVQGEAEPVAVALRAEVVQAFQITPPTLLFGSLSGHTTAKNSFSLQPVDNKPLHILRVESDDASVKVVDWRQMGNTAQVSLAVTGPSLPGDYQKMVTVSVEHPVQHQIVVPVRFRATGLYRLNRPAFNFGNVTGGQAVSQQIDITGAGVEKFALATLPSGMAASLHPVSDQHTVLIVRLNPKGGSSHVLKNTVSVVTQNPQQPRIDIPVYAAVSSPSGAQ